MIMHRIVRSAMAVLVASATLALAVGSASASRGFEQSVASGELGRVGGVVAALTFTDPEGSGEVICSITLTLSLNRTVAKSLGAIVGWVNDARVNTAGCRGGRLRFLFDITRPWRIGYFGFTGTLPNITSMEILIDAWAMLIDAFMGIARCLYRGALRLATVGGLTVTSWRTNEALAIGLFAQLGLDVCPEW